MDKGTTRKIHLDYAKLCIELDVEDGIVEEITIDIGNGKEIHIPVSVPWLPNRCLKCGTFGHDCNRSETNKDAEATEKEELQRKDELPEGKEDKNKEKEPQGESVSSTPQATHKMKELDMNTVNKQSSYEGGKRKAISDLISVSETPEKEKEEWKSKGKKGKKEEQASRSLFLTSMIISSWNIRGYNNTLKHGSITDHVKKEQSRYNGNT